MFVVGYNISSRESGAMSGVSVSIETGGEAETFKIRGGPSWRDQVRCLIIDVCRWYMKDYNGPITVHFPEDPSKNDGDDCGCFVIEAVPVRHRNCLPWLLGPILEAFRDFLSEKIGTAVEIVARPVSSFAPGYYSTTQRDSLSLQLRVKVAINREELTLVSRQPTEEVDRPEEPSPRPELRIEPAPAEPQPETE